MQRLNVECLETRDNPSALVGSDGVLRIHPTTPSNHVYAVTVVQSGFEVSVRERLQGHTTFTRVSVFGLTGLVIEGQKTGRNVLENRTSLPVTMTGGDLADVIKCGSGYNVVDSGRGADRVFLLRGGDLRQIGFSPNFLEPDTIYARHDCGTVTRNPFDRIVYV